MKKIISKQLNKSSISAWKVLIKNLAMSNFMDMKK